MNDNEILSKLDIEVSERVHDTFVVVISNRRGDSLIRMRRIAFAGALEDADEAELSKPVSAFQKRSLSSREDFVLDLEPNDLCPRRLD